MARRDVPDWMVVIAALHRKAVGSEPLEDLQRWSGQPRKVCLRAVERSAERGYVAAGAVFATRSGAALVTPEAVPDRYRYLLTIWEWSYRTIAVRETRPFREKFEREWWAPPLPVDS